MTTIDDDNGIMKIMINRSVLLNKNKMSTQFQRRPEYKNYPLNYQELADLHQEKQVIDKDIRDNLAEIRALNNKMAK